MKLALVSPCLLALLVGVPPVVAQPALTPPTATAVASEDHQVLALVPAQAEPSIATLPSLGSVFRSLGGDFKRLPTWQNLAWLGGTGALALAVQPQDDIITRNAAASPSIETFLDAGAVTGGGYVQVGAAIGTFAVGRIAHSPEVASLGSELIQAQIVNTVLTQGIKLTVGRTRPDGDNYSFPSGHASNSFATATILARRFGWKVGIPAYGMATYVAASRLSERRHFLSDVVFGAGIGIVSARTVTIHHGGTALALAAMPVPGGVEIGFTRVLP